MQKFKSKFKRLGLIALSLIYLFASNHFFAAQASSFCEITHPQKSKVALTHHPFFDTPYKMAANYSPVLVLRALGETNFYRNKGKAHMLRQFYVKDLTGELAEPYETIDLNIEAQSRGFFGRRIIASGKINNYDLYYENKMTIGLPKKVEMDILVALAGCEMMNLKVKTNGSEKNNKVTGNYLGKTVDYLTQWRDTKGILSGTAYEIHASGVENREGWYHGVSNGDIAGFKIKGKAFESKHNHFEMTEEYGYIVVKTILDVDDGSTEADRAKRSKTLNWQASK